MVLAPVRLALEAWCRYTKAPLLNKSGGAVVVFASIMIAMRTILRGWFSLLPKPYSNCTLILRDSQNLTRENQVYIVDDVDVCISDSLIATCNAQLRRNQ